MINNNTVQNENMVQDETVRVEDTSVNFNGYFGNQKEVNLKEDDYQTDLPLASFSRKEYSEAITRLRDMVDEESGDIDISDTEKILLNILEAGEGLKPKGETSDKLILSDLDNSIGMKRIVPTGTSNAQRKARLYATMGVGSVVEVYLPHSGFQITLRPLDPLERAKLSTIKTDGLGNSIAGQVLSTGVGKLVEAIVKLVFSKIVISTTITTKKPVDYVVEADYQIVVLALLSVINVNIDNIIACTNSKNIGKEEGNCNHVVNTKLDPTTFLYINKLPTEATDLITNNTPVANIVKYQEIINKPKSFEVDNLKFTLKFDRINKYFKSTAEWITYLDNKLVGLLLEDEDDRGILTEAITSSILLLFKHLFVSIETNGDTYHSDKKGEIEMVLEAVSMDTEKSDKVITTIQEFIAKTVYNIGVPVYVCPSCDKLVGDEAKSIFSIDVLHSFFVLRDLTQRKRIG